MWTALKPALVAYHADPRYTEFYGPEQSTGFRDLKLDEVRAESVSANVRVVALARAVAAAARKALREWLPGAAGPGPDALGS